MAFLALASQKTLLMLEKNFLQLQYTHVENQETLASNQMSALQEQLGDNYEEDSTYQYYAALDEQLSEETDSLDSQITLIDNELSSLKSLVNSGLKSSCQLNLISG